ncbi:MAG: hypothetical protein JWN76_1805 [Chitinophagaceae bacterium]|nr:hypothetical protein [Chitinophagaceae bacterium]
MKTKYLSFIMLMLSFSLLSCGQAPATRTASASAPAFAVADVPQRIEQKNFDGYSISVPAGWKLFNYGNCSDLSFISWDPAHENRQFFFYGAAGPCYLTAYQKGVMLDYVRMGGARSVYTDMPVIEPFTPVNFVQNFYKISEWIGNSLQRVAQLYNVKVISVTPQRSLSNSPDAQCALIRAVFTDRSKQNVSQGLFLLTTVPVYLAQSGPGANFGVVYAFTGITAPFHEFETLLPVMKKCLDNFSIQDSYAQNCMQISNDATRGILRAGKTLSESSDLIMQTWNNKNRSQDIISEKTHDWIMGRERLYDPTTKQVYEVSNDFTDKYNLSPQKYNKSNLQKLPADNWELWRQAPLSGENIRRVNP